MKILERPVIKSSPIACKVTFYYSQLSFICFLGFYQVLYLLAKQNRGLARAPTGTTDFSFYQQDLCRVWHRRDDRRPEDTFSRKKFIRKKTVKFQRFRTPWSRIRDSAVFRRKQGRHTKFVVFPTTYGKTDNAIVSAIIDLPRQECSTRSNGPLQHRRRVEEHRRRRRVLFVCCCNKTDF